MSTITSSPNKETALARLQALMAGTRKHFPSGSFTLGSTTYTTASLLQAFQALVDAQSAADAAQASAREAVSARRAAAAKVTPLARAYRSFLRTTFSADAAQLADFGMPPTPARKPLASEKRLAATVKLRATRKARGTTSKKQKLAIKGDVTGVLVTPITPAGPSSSPSAPPQPTPATPAGAAPVATPQAGH